MTPEGFEYGPQAAGYVAQFELALHTAGMDDPARFGPQVLFGNNPFWSTFVPAILHSLPPQPVVVDDDQGPVYLPAWYGDGLDYYSPDMIESVAPLALYAAERGDRATVDERVDFLNVLQAGQQQTVRLVDGGGPCVGAAVGSTVVLFPRDIDTPVDECAAGAGPGTRTDAGGALVVTR